VTTRQSILANIVSELQDIVQLESVTAEEVTISDIDTVPMPAAFVVAGPETRIEDGTLGYETWSWDVVIEIWARTNLEELLGLVHSKLYEDYSRGSYALETTRVGADIYTIEADKHLNGLSLTFRILYRHRFGTP
jgi:hypothetical protein